MTSLHWQILHVGQQNPPTCLENEPNHASIISRPTWVATSKSVDPVDDAGIILRVQAILVWASPRLQPRLGCCSENGLLHWLQGQHGDKGLCGSNDKSVKHSNHGLIGTPLVTELNTCRGF